MNARIRRPASHEEASSKQEGAEHHRRQAQFRSHFTAGFAVVHKLIEDVDDSARDCTEEDCEEGKFRGQQFPVSMLAKNDWDST